MTPKADPCTRSGSSILARPRYTLSTHLLHRTDKTGVTKFSKPRLAMQHRFSSKMQNPSGCVSWQIVHLHMISPLQSPREVLYRSKAHLWKEQSGKWKRHTLRLGQDQSAEPKSTVRLHSIVSASQWWLLEQIMVFIPLSRRILEAGQE